MIDDSFIRICFKLSLKDLLKMELVCKEMMKFIRTHPFRSKQFILKDDSVNIIKTHKFSNISINNRNVDINEWLPFMDHCRTIDLTNTNIYCIDQLHGTYKRIDLPRRMLRGIIDNINNGTLQNKSLINTYISGQSIIKHDYTKNKYFDVNKYIELGMKPRALLRILMDCKMFTCIEPILTYHPCCDDLCLHMDDFKKHRKYRVFKDVPMFDSLTYTLINNQQWLTKILIPHVNLIGRSIYHHCVNYAFDHGLIDIIKLLYLYGSKFITFNNNYYTMICKGETCKHKHIPFYSQPI